jgi:spore coat protein U-like protein
MKYHTFVVLCLAVLMCGPAKACLSVDISTTDLDFGTYNPLDNTPLQSNFNVTVDCVTDGLLPALATVFNIGLTSYSESTLGYRALSSGSDQLQYTVSRSYGGGLDWGPLGSGRVFVGNFANILLPPAQIFTGYASIAPRQNVSVGTYTDTLVLEVEF